MAMRASVGLPALPAPLVRAVTQDGPAARAGIRAGDLLMAAGGRPLRSVADVHAALAAAGHGGRLGVRLLRGTSQLELQVSLAKGGDGETAAAEPRSLGGDHFA
jgi:serine protease Do